MELKLSVLQERVPNLERKALSESEVTSLRDQLHQEKLQKLLHGQTISSLQEKLASLEETVFRMEVTLREKQNALLDSERAGREHKAKAQKSKEKVKLIGAHNI